jgi:hypothetical protein
MAAVSQDAFLARPHVYARFIRIGAGPGDGSVALSLCP